MMRWLVAALAVLLVGPADTGRARGESPPVRSKSSSVEVAVSHRGALAQWLALGPLPLHGTRPKSVRLKGANVPVQGGLSVVRPDRPVTVIERVRSWDPRKTRTRATGWTVLSRSAPLLDLREVFGLKRRHHFRAALLGLELRAPTAQTVYLSLSHDDGLSVWLNGSRRLEDERQQSFRGERHLVALPLRRGRNHLVLALTHSKGRWRFRARLFGADHRPLGLGVSKGVRLALPVPAGFKPTLRQLAEPLRLSLTRKVTGSGLDYGLRVSAPGGVVLPRSGAPSKVSVAVKRSDSIGTGRVGVDLRQVARKPRRIGLSGPAVTVWVAGRVRGKYRLPRAARLCKKLIQTETALGRVRASASTPQASIDSVGYHLQDIRRLLVTGDRDFTYLRRRLGVVARWAKRLAQGRDPFPRLRGRIVRAYRSQIDGSFQPYSLYVPSGYTQRKKWPLYVYLHGLDCTHRKGVNQMVGTWMGEKDPITWKQYVRRLPAARLRPRALVLAPQAFGNAYYWHMGEVAVYRALAEVQRLYSVDPSRIVLVGHSMGGTGVLDVGFHQPHRFAGIVSLAGYPTRWIHKEIRDGPLQPWERLQAQRYSPLYWIRNGRYLPLIAVHGTRDGPYKSKSLVQAYKRRRFRADLKLFEYGHSVWRLYLDKGQVYSDTSGWRAARLPRRVYFRTTRLRWNRSHWIQLDARPRAGRWSEVDGRVRYGNRVLVKTKNVDQLTLRLDRPLVRKTRPVKVVLDGKRVTVPWQASLTFHRAGDGWQAGARPAPGVGKLIKKPALEGPLADLHYGPVLVVHGTRDKGQRAALRRVARRLSRFGSSSVRYPVKPDTRVTAADRQKYHLLLVGGPHTNRETARYHKRLPIQISAQEVRVGRCRFSGRDIGVKFIHPNPEAPHRYLVVVAGTTALGVLREHLVPRYLPDFVVYDKTMEAPGGTRILGPHRRYLTAGFFTRKWQIPTALKCAR